MKKNRSYRRTIIMTRKIAMKNHEQKRQNEETNQLENGKKA